MQEYTSEATLSQKEFSLFREMIYQDAGISLGDSKHQLVESRLAKRLRSRNLSSYAEYYRCLMEEDHDGRERLKMINCLTTNKTDFFRENHHFEYLRQVVFPEIERRAKETGERRLRIWSAACSSGEEPYSLAMTVLDHFGPTSFHGWDIRILASDVDTDVLAHAQRGIYEADRVADIPRETLKRHFIRTSKDPDAAVQIRPEVQSLITFRRINFIESDWPIQTQFDAVFCRNVMIYFDEATQDRLLTRFSAHMKPEGYLFIGHSESIIRLDHLYRSLGNTVYRLVPETSSPVNGSAGSQNSSTKKSVRKTSVSGSSDDRAASASRKVTARKSRDAQSVHSKSAPGSSAEQRAGADSIPVHSIIVGEVKASAEPLRITTLVGSCIAVCLYDPVAMIGGMNHFMLPENNLNGNACATYGIPAIKMLISDILKLGGERHRLTAKIFGGGNVLRKSKTSSPVVSVGDRNVSCAVDFLKCDGIPVAASDVGGCAGRIIHFLTHTGQAMVRKIQTVEEDYDLNDLRIRRSDSRSAVNDPEAEQAVTV